MLANLLRKKGLDFYQVAGHLQTDLHSHILPGIDDGARDIRESLELLKAMERFGFRKVITTPHVKFGKFPNTPESIFQARDLLLEAKEEAGINLEVEVAAEYFLDDHFIELIKEKSVLTFGKNSYLLFEFSMVYPPMNLDEILFDMQSAGYTPVLAHPERYAYFSKYRDEDFQKLKDRGVYFQSNIYSFSDFYGSGAQKTLKRLLKGNFIDFLGTDIHNPHQVSGLDKIRFPIDPADFLNTRL